MNTYLLIKKYMSEGYFLRYLPGNKNFYLCKSGKEWINIYSNIANKFIKDENLISNRTYLIEVINKKVVKKELLGVKYFYE